MVVVVVVAVVVMVSGWLLHLMASVAVLSPSRHCITDYCDKSRVEPCLRRSTSLSNNLRCRSGTPGSEHRHKLVVTRLANLLPTNLVHRCKGSHPHTVVTITKPRLNPHYTIVPHGHHNTTHLDDAAFCCNSGKVCLRRSCLERVNMTCSGRIQCCDTQKPTTAAVGHGALKRQNTTARELLTAPGVLCRCVECKGVCLTR